MKQFKNTALAALCGIAIAFGSASCTNLDENVYSSLTPQNLSGTEQETEDMIGNLYVQLRFMYWAWEGYFDINGRVQTV